nr:T9SS type A sorting domain-containing protein [Cytophagales bacterium]
MKVLFSAFFIATIYLFTLSVGFAAHYYVSSKTGNDNRTMEEAQNPNTPWKSIEKVNALSDAFKPDDVILFTRGETFFGTLHLKSSGSTSSPIRIGAYGAGQKPVITSLQTITSWKAVGNGIFESAEPIGSDPIQVLLINGLLQDMGRYPNAGSINDGYLTIDQSGNNVIFNEQLDASPVWTGGEIVIRIRDWIINTYKIDAHSGKEIRYNGGISASKAEVGYGFFIQNHLRTLDVFGEWYHDPVTKKMSVYFGSANPSELVVEVSTLDHLLIKDFRVGNIVVENIHFKGANGSTVYFEGGENITIRDSEIAYSGEDGIQALSVLNLLIERNSINHTYNNGMYLRFGNHGSIINENSISNTSLYPGRTRNDDQAGIGIFVSGENILVQYNAVVNTGFNGIQFNGNNVRIKHNFVADFCRIKSDGAGIYTYGGSTFRSYTERLIEGNIVTNGIGSVGGIPRRGIANRALVDGIFLDDNSNNVDVIGNSIGSVANGGLKLSNVSEINVSGNTFFDADFAIILGNNERAADTRNVTIANNQFFTKFPDQHSLFVSTYKDDIGMMADFDNNHYFRPLGDQYSILTRFANGRETEEAVKDLIHWRERFGKDPNSISNVVDVARYTIDKKIGDSLYPNSFFDRNISGIDCNHCKQSWEADSKLTGGALKINSSASSSVKIDIGELKKEKTYLVKFKAYADKAGSLKVYLRYSGAPWERLSGTNTFEVTPEVGIFETIVSPYQDASEVSLMIADSESDFTYWLDDLEIVEVEASLVDPNDATLFAYNPSKTGKTLALAGTYVNAKLEKFSGTVTIPSYSSLALFRVSKEGIEDVPQSGHRFFLNIGGLTDEKLNGNTFLAETGLERYFNLGSGTYENGKVDVDAIFQTERFSKILKYTIPVPNGKYTVFTMHNELWFGRAGSNATSGSRVFDIAVQGKVLKRDFDIFLENNNNPTLLSFKDISVTGGMLTLEMTAKVNNASISGIAIIGNIPKNDAVVASLIRFQQSGVSEKDIEEEKITHASIRVFPNPAKERVTFEIGTVINSGNVSIHNMNGQLVSNFNLEQVRISETRFEIPTTNLAAGVYQISVTNEHKLLHKKSLIVTK